MKNYQDQQTIIPYLMLENALAFVEFAKIVFDAGVTALHLADDNRTVLNAELQIGHNVVLLSEAKDKYGKAVGNFLVYVGNADDTFNRALFHGASVVTDLADMDYGRIGGVEDPFGNTWWITAV
jgi:PhnB protein